MKIPDDLVQILRKSRRIVALTGAGVSKESGIPTFREAQTGLWAKYDPMQLATPQAYRRNPALVWDWYRWRRKYISEVEPNPGHVALVEMERLIPEFYLITQNIDGLHRQAGNEKLIELHGNIFRNKCFEEGIPIDGVDNFRDFPPQCPECGGLIRPDVVWFGENLLAENLELALQVTQAAEVFLSIGTSSLVQPAASLPLLALERGAVIVQINPDDTILTPQVHFVLRGASGEILPQLVRITWNSV